jgi:hypothetical protein
LSSWLEVGSSSNQAQLDAVTHIEGPLFLRGGDGLRVLLSRTINLIVFHEIKSEEISLSTFTEKAAFQFRWGAVASWIGNEQDKLALRSFRNVHRHGSLAVPAFGHREEVLVGANSACQAGCLIPSVSIFLYAGSYVVLERTCGDNTTVNRLFAEAASLRAD